MRVSTETSFVLLIVGHGNLLVITEMCSWSLCLFTSGPGSPVAFISHLGARTLPGCVRTVCPDSLHSHSLARVLLPLDPHPHLPQDLQD